MTTPAITTLKLRKLKPCMATTRLLNSLPDIQEFGERMFQFDVKIPTKLWKALLRRRDSNHDTNFTLGQARSKADSDIQTCEDETALGILDSHSYVRSDLHNAVYVTPVYTELFDKFGIRVHSSVVIFYGPYIVEFIVILCDITGEALIGDAVFDVSHFPAPAEKPSGSFVSYIINS